MVASRHCTFLVCVTVFLAPPVGANQSGTLSVVRHHQLLQRNKPSEPPEEPSTVYPLLFSKSNMQSGFGHNGYHRLSDSLAPKSKDEGIEKINEDLCIRDIETAVQAFQQRETWALQMYDAMGKVGPGAMDRYLRYWGDYQECLDVRINGSFHTKYCMAYILVLKFKPFQWTQPRLAEVGLCVPSTCNVSTVTNLLDLYMFKQPDVTGKAMSIKCQERTLPFTPGAIVAICICSTMAILLLLGTAYDISRLKNLPFMSRNYVATNENYSRNSHCVQDGPSTGNSDQAPVTDSTNKRSSPLVESGNAGIASQFLLSFSVMENASKLLSTFSHQSELLCVNGLRVLSMAGIVYGHTMSNGLKPCDNGPTDLQNLEKRLSPFMSMGFMCVENFFLLSGLLVAYSLMPRVKAKGMNFRFVAKIYLLRYLRLTPPYFLVLFTYTQLFKYVSHGPIWRQNGLDGDSCDQFPWNNLIYINNYVSVGPKCMDWSWYLAVDMQFFLISPIIIFCFYYFDRKGLLVPILLTAVSTVVAGVISYNNKLAPIVDPVKGGQATTDYMALYYFKPYTRYASYGAGMVLGFLLERCRCHARLSKRTVAVGWVSSIVTLFVVIFLAYVHENYGPMSNGAAAVYNALHKLAWSLAICWVIYACATGYGGVVNSVLSSTFFSPLSKITYMMYLVHLLVINFYTLSSKKPTYLDGQITYTYNFAGFTVLSFALAFVVTLAFEAPFVGLMRMLRQRKSLQSIEESRL